VTHWDLVVFDIDDTLYLERDYVRSGFTAVERAAAGLPPDFASLAWELFESGRRGDIFDAALEHHADATARIPELVEIYRSHLPTIRPLPDAATALDVVRRDTAIAVVTDGPATSQRAKAAALGLSWLGPQLVLTADLGPSFGKPHPRAFELIEERTGVGGNRAVYVADNPAKDFGGPRSLGWSTVRIRRPGSLHEAVDSGDDVDVEVVDLAMFSAT